jgi:hypothetical protein
MAVEEDSVKWFLEVAAEEVGLDAMEDVEEEVGWIEES